MFEFCITPIIGWTGSQITTHLALHNFEIFPQDKTKKNKKKFSFFITEKKNIFF